MRKFLTVLAVAALAITLAIPIATPASAEGCFAKDVKASRDTWKTPFHAMGEFLGKTVSAVPVLYPALQGVNTVVLGAGGDAVGTTLGVVGGVIREATGCK